MSPGAPIGRSAWVSCVTGLVLALAGGLAGCEAGSVGRSSTPAAEEDGPVPGAPEVLCEASLGIGGTFVAGMAPPPGLGGGCWPVGTWSLQVALVDPGNCTEVVFEPSYEYQVTRGPSGAWQVAYPAHPGAPALLGVKGASGDCLGTFEHLSADRTRVVQLKAHVAVGSSQIAGTGSYTEFAAPQ
jgi:hypothetical protein